MTHIVFNEADAKVLQQAIDLDESLRGDIVQIKDDYSVGPLSNIYVGEGIENRKQWWRDVLAGGDYDGRADSGYGLLLTHRHTERRTPVWCLVCAVSKLMPMGEECVARRPSHTDTQTPAPTQGQCRGRR